MADAVTGMDSTKPTGTATMKEDEDELSFSHEFFVYGGSDHLEELENISTKCGTICQNIKVHNLFVCSLLKKKNKIQ